MAENPYPKTMIQSGYYDGATDDFSPKYSMWQMDRSGQLRDRFRFETYRSGHMTYLREEDQESSNQDIREFDRVGHTGGREPALHGRSVPVTADDNDEENDRGRGRRLRTSVARKPGGTFGAHSPLSRGSST